MPQECVACVVPVRVVDRLQPVEVERHQGERGAAGDGAIEPVGEPAPVHAAGQGVGAREAPQRLLVAAHRGAAGGPGHQQGHEHGGLVGRVADRPRVAEDGDTRVDDERRHRRQHERVGRPRHRDEAERADQEDHERPGGAALEHDHREDHEQNDVGRRDHQRLAVAAAREGRRDRHIDRRQAQHRHGERRDPGPVRDIDAERVDQRQGGDDRTGGTGDAHGLSPAPASTGAAGRRIPHYSGKSPSSTGSVGRLHR